MVKVGIITIHNVNNYGAEFQASALYQKVKNLGHDVEIIGYYFYKSDKFKFTSKAKPLFKHSFKTRIKDYLVVKREKFVNFFYYSRAKKRKFGFEEYHKQNSKFGQLISSIDELYDTNHEYDIYIVGSDQVWNPGSQVNLEPYFLTFAPNNAIKVSYASSFGIDSFEQTHKNVYGKLLGNINHLSCREKSGVSFINSVGLKAEHVLDPALLLTKNEWLMKAKEEVVLNKPYILVFAFKKSEYISTNLLKLKEKFKCDIVRITPTAAPFEKDESIINLTSLSPAGFLHVFSNAEKVITTSFHGTVFSTIFEKPFLTITPSSKNNNARQKDYLNLLGLENQLIKEGENVDWSELFNFDFSNATEILKNERLRSVNFLENSMNDAS